LFFLYVYFQIIDKKLYTGSHDGTLRVWDLSGMKDDTTFGRDALQPAKDLGTDTRRSSNAVTSVSRIGTSKGVRTQTGVARSNAAPSIIVEDEELYAETNLNDRYNR